MLTLRKDVGSGKTHYHYTNPYGKKFSVLDCGTLMSTMPNYDKIKEIIFVGWEGMESDGEGGLIHEYQYRHETWEKLQKILDAVK